MTDRLPLLIVSEPARLAAVSLMGNRYQVLTYTEVTIDALEGRQILFWPDAGEAIKSRTLIYSKYAKELKRITTNGQPKGWNLSHAVKDGWTFEAVVEWARAHVQVIPSFAGLPEPLKDLVPAENAYGIKERYGLACRKTGEPYSNAANVVKFLSRDETYRGHIWFDEFSNTIMTDITGIPLGWTDSKTNDLVVYLQSTLGMHTLTDRHVASGILFFAEQDRRHQVKDWLNRLVWDGKPRIGTFFSTYMGAEETASNNAFGNNFWVLMVKRVMRPGSQADYMVVLEGAQGIGKTQAFQVIGGEWYGEVGITADSEEFERQLQGRILVEISELQSFTKSDQARIKQIITKRNDIYREKYGKFALNHQRQGILVGTTNETEWIKDQTGGRRFWPLSCGDIDLKALKRDREQLFAEALQRLKDGDEGYQVPTNETAELQESRREHEIWEDVLESKLVMTDSVTLFDAMKLLGIKDENLNGRDASRVKHCLRHLGFHSKPSRIEGVLKRIWVKNGNVTVI